jgi:hypothetical protein
LIASVWTETQSDGMIAVVALCLYIVMAGLVLHKAGHDEDG